MPKYQMAKNTCSFGDAGEGRDNLVVDDSLAWLRFAREILTAGGCQAQTCEDPREALSLLEQNPERIDLVITDLQMPGLDGIELAAELLKIKPTLPVVLTSAAIFQMCTKKLRSVGIRDFLPSPGTVGSCFLLSGKPWRASGLKMRHPRTKRSDTRFHPSHLFAPHDAFSVSPLPHFGVLPSVL